MYFLIAVPPLAYYTDIIYLEALINNGSSSANIYSVLLKILLPTDIILTDDVGKKKGGATMKRFFLILALLIVLSVPALAEPVDYSSMTLEQLIEMRAAINREIDAWIGTSATAIYSGVFVVGKDIKPGRYVLILEKGLKYPTASTYFGTEKYADDSQYQAYELRDGESTYIELVEGMTFTLDQITIAYLQPLTKPDWAP